MKKLALLSLLGPLALAQALELKLEPMGTINVSGILTVYTTHSNNKTDEKKNRYDVGSAIISLSKSAEPFGFTLIGVHTHFQWWVWDSQKLPNSQTRSAQFL